MRSSRASVARLTVGLALCVAGGMPAQSASSSSDELRVLLTAIAELADRSTRDAAFAVIRNLRAAAPVSLRAAVRDAERDVLHAFLTARATLPPGHAMRAWLDYFAASTLTDFGCHAIARQHLAEIDVPSAPAPAEQDAWRGHAPWLARSLTLRADLERRAGDAATALSTCETALAMVMRCADQAALRADLLGVRGRIWSDLGVVDPAARDLHEQLQRARRSGDPVSLRHAFSNQIELAIAMGRADRVAAIENDARSELGTDLGAEFDALLGIAAALRGSADRVADDAAEARLRAALARPLPPSLSARAQLAHAQLELRNGRTRSAHTTLRALRRDLDAVAADDSDLCTDLEVASSMLARRDGARWWPCALQLVRNLRQHQRLERQWRAAPLRADGIAFLAARHRRALLGECFELAEIVGGAAFASRLALTLLLRVQALDTESRAQGVETITLANLRAEFATPGSIVLCLLAAQSCSYAFVVDAAVVRTFRLPPWSDIVRPLDEFRSALEVSVRRIPADGMAGHERELLRRGREVAELILPGELRDLLLGARLVTVADHGLLRHVALECLVLPDRSLLGQHVAVNTLSSLPFGLRVLALRVPQPVPRATARIDAFVALEQADDPIERAEQRARASDAAARLSLAWPSRSIRTGVEATRAAVLETRFEGMVVQFVAHGVSGESGDGRPSLALHGTDEQRLLRAVDVESHTFPGVIVLSVCEAARARLQVGEGRMLGTLGGAFTQAGAHTVVQSSVDLLLEPHLQLCERLYVHLLAGAPFAEALRLARDELARGSARGKVFEQFQHALVQVFGMGHRPLVRAQPASARDDR